MAASLPKFLFVEDDPLAARALARVARRLGEVTLVPSVQAALQHLSAQPWGAFVIDVGLPDGSGLEVLAEARAAFPGVPAMLLTGRVERDLINRAFDLRAQYVVKPVDPARMRRFLSEATTSPGPVRPPETIHEAIAHLRVLLARRADTRTRYAIGALVASVKAHPEQFGRSAIASLATAVGQREPTLYRHAWVAEAFSEPELDELLARTGPGGSRITWSHLVTLAMVTSASRRRELIERVVVDGLSVRGLVALVAPGGLRAKP